MGEEERRKQGVQSREYPYEKDPLTGVYTRQGFWKVLQEEFGAAMASE